MSKKTKHKDSVQTANNLPDEPIDTTVFDASEAGQDAVKPTSPTSGQVNMRISQLTLENDIRNGKVSDVPNVSDEEVAIIQSRLNAVDVASLEEVTAVLNVAAEQNEEIGGPDG